MMVKAPKAVASISALAASDRAVARIRVPVPGNQWMTGAKYKDTLLARVQAIMDADIYSHRDEIRLDERALSLALVMPICLFEGGDAGSAMKQSTERMRGHRLEILDPDTLQPVPPGEWGEMVVTTLAKEGAPLIRYRTRDLTSIVDGPCACGRTHRTYGLYGSYGRYRRSVNGYWANGLYRPHRPHRRNGRGLRGDDGIDGVVGVLAVAQDVDLALPGAADRRRGLGQHLGRKCVAQGFFLGGTTIHLLAEPLDVAGELGDDAEREYRQRHDAGQRPETQGCRED